MDQVRTSHAFHSPHVMNEPSLETRLTRTLESITYAFVTLDRQWRFTYVNPHAERVLGRSRDELVGRVIWDEFPAAVSSSFYQGYHLALRDNRTVHFEEYYPPLGLWLSVHAYPSEEGLAVYFQDITEERRVRTRLEFQSQLLERVTHPIVAFDDHDRVTYWNEAAEKLLGWSADEVVGRPLPELFPEEEKGRVAGVRETLRQGEEWTGEIKALHRGGDEVHLRLATAPANTPEGSPGGRIVSAVDVTELRVSQDRMGLATEAGGIGVYDWREPEEESWISDSLYELYGMDPGRDAFTLETWLERIYPKDRERARGELERAREVGNTYESEFRVLYPEGILRWVSTRGRIIRRSDGTLDRMVGVVFDVTERKRAEEAVRESERLFRQIAETVEGVFWISPPDRNVMEYVSPGYATIWGRPPEELYADPGLWVEAVHPDDRHRVREAMRRQAEGEYDLEYRIVRPDGTVRWIWDRGFPIETATGEVQRIVGIAEDITERRKLEEQLRQAQKMEAVGRLSGGVAHDFNNRLTVIQNSSQLLLDELPRDSPLRATVQDILRESARAASSTRQLLAFGRNRVLDERTLDMGQLVRRLRPMLQSLVPESIDLRFEGEEEGVLFRADRNEMEQVVLNLVINASDATPDLGRITLRVHHAALSERDVRDGPGHLSPGRYVRLEVEDTGPGMDPEVRERIFEPFFTTKPAHKGTGLGLSTVFGIVQQSGGDIQVDSEPGQGTTFRVLLPATDAAAAVDPEEGVFRERAEPETREPAAPEPEAASPHPPPSEVEEAAAADETASSTEEDASGQEGTILLVEDELQVRRVACRVLQRAGFQVLDAATGDQALELWARHGDRVDLVVSDVVMPEMNGSTLVDQLRESRPDLPVVLMSGYSEKELGQEARRKATAFLEKPFAPDDLAEAIQAALAKGSRRP